MPFRSQIFRHFVYGTFMACSLTCILPIDTCLSATSVHGSDDSTHESPLPNACTHSTFSLAARYLFDTCCVLTFATCLDVHCARGLHVSVHERLLATVCTTFTLAVAIALLLLLSDLSVTESSTDSTLIWLFSSVALLATMLGHDALAEVKGILLHLYNSFHRSAAPQDLVKSIRATCTFVRSIFGTSGSGRDSRNPPLPSSLWHFALAFLHDIFVNLICVTCNNSLASMSRLLATRFEELGMIELCSQFASQTPLDVTNSRHEVFDATCTSPRLDFTHLSSGWALRSPPLPSPVTNVTTKMMEEDALTWASNINSEESLPLSSTNSPHCSDDFAVACTCLTTFTPSFHHTECPDEDGFLPPILDTGATHCLLPLRWMTNEQAGSSKKIHLHVASGRKVRALLHDNIIYCATVTRPLISVGQLEPMLDLRFIWSESAPLLAACSGGLKYVLLEATIFHNLPVITSHR